PEHDTQADPPERSVAGRILPTAVEGIEHHPAACRPAGRASMPLDSVRKRANPGKLKEWGNVTLRAPHPILSDRRPMGYDKGSGARSSLHSRLLTANRCSH